MAGRRETERINKRGKKINQYSMMSFGLHISDIHGEDPTLVGPRVDTSAGLPQAVNASSFNTDSWDNHSLIWRSFLSDLKHLTLWMCISGTCISDDFASFLVNSRSMYSLPA